ncbi:MAG: hypothetical protein U0835_20095 [Isosphaeraceae bacterium]
MLPPPSASTITPSPDPRDPEDGSTSAVMVLVVLFVMLLALMLMNQAQTVFGKVDLQNRADVVALTLAKRTAIAMNKLVVFNHRTGEELAKAAVTLALVGETVSPVDLPPNDQAEAHRLAGEIKALAAALRVEGQSPFADGTLSRSLEYGGAAGQAMIRLRRALVEDYAARLASGVDDPTAERAILNEWNAVDRVADATAADRPEALRIVKSTVPGLLAEADELVKARPGKSVRISQVASGLNDVDPALFPKRPGLPVVPESHDLGGSSPAKSFRHAQIVESAWPWVLVLRRGLAARLARDTLSDAEGLFRDWTETMTLRLAREVYASTGLAMYILMGSQPGRKGFEAWTHDREAADELFSVVVLTHRPPLLNLAPGLFRTQQPDGPVAHAQYFLHSAPPQKPGSLSAPLQPDVGWDTLNWSTRVASFPHDGPVVTPTYRPRWDARLMPVTRLDEAGPHLEGSFRQAVQPFLPAERSIQTH